MELRLNIPFVMSCMCGALVAGCGGSTPAATLEEAAGSKFKIERGDNQTSLVFRTGVLTEATPFDQGALHLHDLGRWMQQTGKWPAGRLTLKTIVPTIDRYGNKSESEAYAFDFDMADLRKVKFLSVSYHVNVFDFAKIRFISPFAQNGAREFCKSNAQLIPNFCRQVR